MPHPHYKCSRSEKRRPRGRRTPNRQCCYRTVVAVVTKSRGDMRGSGAAAAARRGAPAACASVPGGGGARGGGACASRARHADGRQYP